MTVARLSGGIALLLIGSVAAFPACHGDDIHVPTPVPGPDAAESGATPEGLDDAGGAHPGAGDAGAPGPGVDAGSTPPDANAIDSGATGVDAGDGGGPSRPDASANEAGVASPCTARSGLLFCDDFEAAKTAALPAPWSTSIVGSGTVTVDSSTPAHSGTKSIHVSDGDADYDTLLVLHDASVLPAPGGRFYVRVFMRLGAAMSAGHNTFLLADLFATQGQHNDLRLGEDDQMLMYTVMGDAHGALSNANYYNDGMLPGIQIAAGAWTCLEVLLDSTKPEIDVWVGGKEVPDLHHTDFPLDDYDNVRLGFEKYGGPAMDIWYDDVAIGTQPIGCD